MNVLLFYEMIPSQTKVYWFEGLKSEIVERLKRCHARLMGIESNPDLDWFNRWILDQDEYVIYNSIDDSIELIEIKKNCLLICTGVFNE
jgi:hypothetical protein